MTLAAHPFGLSLSKATPSTSDAREEKGFNKLSPNGGYHA
jgi:hypothetical protein